MRRWFDLKPLGGKAERIADANGVLHLALTLENLDSVGREVLEAAVKKGWVPATDAPSTFRNYRRFTKMSEVADALSPFFGEDPVLSSVTARPNLSQGEVIEGLDRDDGPPGMLGEIEKNLLLMPEGKRSLILQRVAAVQKLAGVGAGVGSTVFGNDAIALWDALADRHGRHDATGAMIVGLQLASQRGEKFAEYEALLIAAGSGAPMPTLYRDAEAGSTPRRLAEAFIGAEWRAATARAQGAAGGRVPERDFYLDAMLYTGALVAHPAFDGAGLDFGQAGEPESFGHKFFAEPGIPRSLKADAYHRASRALAFVADQLDASPEHLFGNATVIFHLSRRIATGTAGRYHSRSSDVGGVRFSPYAPAAFIHEVGHAVDYAFGRGPEKYEALLDETGVTRYVKELVQAFAPPPAMSRYLLDPVEVFARSFSAAMVNTAVEAGDPAGRQFGGILMASAGFDFSPLREPGLSRRFLERLVDWNRDAGVHLEAGGLEHDGAARAAAGI